MAGLNIKSNLKWRRFNLNFLNKGKLQNTAQNKNIYIKISKLFPFIYIHNKYRQNIWEINAGFNNNFMVYHFQIIIPLKI